MGLNCPVSMELMVFRETPANCASWVWDSHVTETGPDSGAAPDLKVDFESAGRKVWTRIIFMKEELKIRCFCREDTEELFRLISDPEVMRYLEPPYSRDAAERLLEEAGLGEAPLIYAVEDKEGRFAGYVIYHKYEEDGMELGWVLKREVWHKGYADKLTEMLLKDAVGKAAYAVIECAPEQKATRRIAVKHGFVYSGRSEGCDVYIRRFEKTLDSHITS